MDVIQALSSSSRSQPIICIDMHTTGEPTRIVLRGYPDLTKGTTLLEQRAEAKRDHDNVRKMLLLEPRGHFDMYGAILRPDTELTRMGTAHMGVLFMTNDGYSTMCGHATIALGRFLLDTHDESVFPRRSEVKHDPVTKMATLFLHAPCGLLEVSVPVDEDGKKSDPSRPVSFVSVPSFATGIQIDIPVPIHRRWPEFGEREVVTADFSYGGAFYCMVHATELGFPERLRSVDYAAMNLATKNLKAAVNENSKLHHLFHHPDHDDLGFLYSIMVVDTEIGKRANNSSGVETGLCYFSDQQIDRSPTGSAVSARCALAYAKGHRRKGETWTYHSLLSNAWNNQGAFLGTVVEEIGVTRTGFPMVRTTVSGFASYVGFSTYVVEENDPLGASGFVFEQLNAKCT